MSSILDNSPGLEQASDLPLDLSTPEGRVFRNLLDNVFYLRRVVTDLDRFHGLSREEVIALIQAALTKSKTSGLVIKVGTHLERITTYGTANYPVGTVYFEYDRSSLYTISASSGTKKWVYSSGSMTGLISAIPTDLGVSDAGFFFTDTTTDQETEWLWSGTEWVTVGGYLQSVTDASSSAVTTIQVLEHLVAAAGAAGMGSRQLMRLKDNAPSTQNATGIKAVVTTAAAATFTTKWVVELRSAGAALADFFEVLTTGIRVKVGSFWGRFTHANTADRVYTFADADGNIVYQTSALTDHAVVIGNSGQKVKPLGSLGTTTTVLHGNATGDPSFSAVSLTADVSGTLPVANGGTGATDAAGARSNLSAALISSGLPHTIPLAKVTGGGANGSLTLNADGSFSWVDPT